MRKLDGLQSSYEKMQKNTKVPMKNAMETCVFLDFSDIL